ncbi:MAG: SDR family NAD(P)-dependent oxidoreductase, partial [Deltaproteobacteria bacterium]|nr:SDR family NAD(P)-dependent oxidoreductase [Deltaproteobacteria bacterium]
MKALVTGGAGFIGSHLCERLLSLGHAVCCVDNFDDFYNPAIKRKNIAEAKKSRNFTLVEEDILDFREIRKLVARADMVFHLAARAGVRPSIEQPHLYQKVNIEGTLNILEAMKEAKKDLLVFASSSSVYGKNSKLPFSEKDNLSLAISPYAASKAACEIFCHAYSHLYGMNITALRFFTVYGPRQRPEMAINKFIEKILNHRTIELYEMGESRRDYTYIDDIISGILLSSERLRGFHVYNLGSSNPVSLKDLVNIIETALEKKARLKLLPQQAGDVS